MNNIDEIRESLKAIDRRSLVDKVEKSLIELFIMKELKPGDIIPKEVELAELMDVSRTVIRESLNRLKTRGLIESVKHKGSIIKSPDLLSLLQKSMIPWILDHNTLKNIFEMRLVIEVGMSDLIVSRATDKDIDELFDIVKDEPEVTAEILFDIDYEIKFHSKLYDITANEMLRDFQKLLLPIFNYVYSSGLIYRPLDRIRHVSHKGLVEILKTRNAEEFRLAMRKHLNNHFQRILKS